MFFIADFIQLFILLYNVEFLHYHLRLFLKHMRYTEGGCINPRAAGKIIKRWLQFASKRKSLEILRLFHKPEYLLMTIFFSIFDQNTIP